MHISTALQDKMLDEITEQKIPVTVFLMNGFQIRGMIMDHDDDEATKKCSECGRRLKVVLTKEEQEELTKQNDDMVAINTMMPM